MRGSITLREPVTREIEIHGALPRLWGWSWRGWVALLVLGAMLIAMARGVDLRHEIQKLVMPLGWGVQAWFAGELLPALRFGAELRAAGPITLCWMLLALHVAPIRWRGWTYATLALLCAVLPWCWWKTCAAMMAAKYTFGGMLPTAPWVNGVFAMNAVLSYLPVVGVVWAATRWWRLALAMMTAALVLIMPSGHVRFTRLSFDWMIAYTIGVNGVLCSMLAAWGWRARRRTQPEHVCRGCGYDLRGIGSGVCPECGKSRTDGHTDSQHADASAGTKA